MSITKRAKPHLEGLLAFAEGLAPFSPQREAFLGHLRGLLDVVKEAGALEEQLGGLR